MPYRRPKFPAELCFTAEHMAHLEAVIKLLARSPGGMSAAEVDNVADSLVRLRNAIVVEASRQRARDAVREVEPVPFREFQVAPSTTGRPE